MRARSRQATAPERNAVARLLSLSPEDREAFLGSLSESEIVALNYDWKLWARAEQLLPDLSMPWFVALWLAGRGWGKTRTGAQSVIEMVQSHGYKRGALIAPTAADARDVMIEGESGILACSHPDFQPIYEPSKRRLTWPNGAVATAYSAEKPRSLRGPQHDFVWGDEPAVWQYGETFDMAVMGLRLGLNPKMLLTTTPKRVPHLKNIIQEPTTLIIRGRTVDNAPFLAAPYLAYLESRYAGTTLGRQELDAEMLDDAEDALWKRHLIDMHRVPWARKPKQFVRLGVAIDPPASDNPTEFTAECGIVVAGLAEDGYGYCLADYSLEKPTPAKWARKALSAYIEFQADCIVAEGNQGGAMVRFTIETVAREMRISPMPKIVMVNASRGKIRRAEPIASLSEQGRIRHVGSLPKLEDELCTYEEGKSMFSPDRLDAYVWAFWWLFRTEVSKRRRASATIYSG